MGGRTVHKRGLIFQLILRGVAVVIVFEILWVASTSYFMWQRERAARARALADRIHVDVLRMRRCANTTLLRERYSSDFYLPTKAPNGLPATPALTEHAHLTARIEQEVDKLAGLVREDNGQLARLKATLHR